MLFLQTRRCPPIGGQTIESRNDATWNSPLLKGRRNSIVAGEGIPYLLASVVATVAVGHYIGILWAALPLALVVYLYLVFRDPPRSIPAAPLGVVSPVDGEVLSVGVTENGAVGGEAQRIMIRVDHLGTYTARSPIEGKIMDLVTDVELPRESVASGGLWVRTDEGEDVVLQFSGHRFGLPPRAFLRYGERVGQGQRCAYLRLTRTAEIQLPLAARVLVSAGQRVAAGQELLAKLPHH